MITQRADVRQYVFMRDSGMCGICGEPVLFTEMHLDHIVPLCAGGADEESNLQVAHPACNFRKNGEYNGVRPNQLRKALTNRFLLRLPADLRDELQAWAEEEDRSLNGQVVHILRRAIAEWRQG